MVVGTRRYGKVILVGSYGGVVIVLLLMVVGGCDGSAVVTVALLAVLSKESTVTG